MPLHGFDQPLVSNVTWKNLKPVETPSEVESLSRNQPLVCHGAAVELLPQEDATANDTRSSSGYFEAIPRVYGEELSKNLLQD